MESHKTIVFYELLLLRLVRQLVLLRLQALMIQSKWAHFPLVALMKLVLMQTYKIDLLTNLSLMSLDQPKNVRKILSQFE